jgi:uncharacterized protein YkwD
LTNDELPFPSFAGVAAATFIAASCAGPADGPAGDGLVRDAGKNRSELGRLEAEINRYRRSVGREPIQRHPGLDRMAQQHCEFMAMNPGKFDLGSTIISHYGFEERTLRAQRQHGMVSLAENVAGGAYSPAMASRFVVAWAASPGHDFNLRQDWDAVGLGVHITPGGTAYATQLFATRSNSHFQMSERMRGF